MRKTFFGVLVAVMALPIVSAFAAEPVEPDGHRGNEKLMMPIGLEMPHDGFATIAIDDAHGRRVRNLISEMPFKKGKQTVYWDGLDGYGIMVPPGKYSWKGLTRGPLHLAYQFSINTPNTPSWHTPDSSGAWIADHSPPMCAFAYGNVVFLSSPGPEANHAMAACDLAGKKLWGWRHGMGDGPTQIACDGKYLYCLSDQGTAYLYRFELIDGGLRRGKQIPFEGKDAFHKVSQYDVGEWAPHTHGFACLDGKLYASHTYVDTILEMDARSADVLRKLSVPKPRGLVVGPDKQLYVVSDRTIGILNLKTGSLEPIITGQNEIRSIAFGPDGRLFAGDMETKQVRVFAKENGTWRQALIIGEAGGRSRGPYNPQRMTSTYALAVDKLGHVWVAEAGFHPKRVSKWDGKTGKLIEEFIGPPMYGGGGYFDPKDKSRFVYNGVEFAVDWDSGEWHPANVLQTVPQPVTASGVGVDARGFPSKIAYRADNRYLVNNSSWLSFAMISGIVDGVARPLSMAWSTKPPSGLKVWTDANGDGELQEEEVESFEKENFKMPDNDGLTGAPWCWGLKTIYGPDFSLYLEYCGSVWFLPVKAWNEHGAPEYDPGKLRRRGIVKSGTGSSGVDSAGNLIFGSPLRRMSPDGKVHWRYPNDWVSVHGSHRAPGPAPGRIIGALDMMGVVDLGGEIGETFALNGNLGQQFLLTADGLFIASLFKDYRNRPKDLPPIATRGILLDDTCIGPEPFFQSYGKTPDNTVYVVCGKEDTKVVEIQGLESLKRTGGSFNVDRRQLLRWHNNQKERAIKIAEAERAAGTRKYFVRRTARPIPLRTNDEKEFWPDEQRMRIEMPHGTTEASLAFDDDYLYVKVDARYEFPGLFRNAAKQPADGRAGVELRLMAAGAGNLRPASLFFAILDEQPAATLDGAALPDAEVQMGEGQSWPHDDTSMRLRARVPMRALKLQIMAGQEVRGDVGIVWASDEAVCGRSYWADRSGSATIDPRCWGTFVWSAEGARRKYTVARAKRTITVDGKLNDWAGVPAMTFPPGEESARVRVQWSDQTIYLAYRVSDSPPLRNLGQDWTMLFKTGGCADFQLGALGSAGKPANPQRLLFSMFDGKPVAVLHRPDDALPAPAGSNKWANVRYRSPVFDITFAAVYRLTKPQVAVIQTEDGYIIEAAVPAEQLGLKLRAGLTIAGDAGLVVSNEAGSAVTRRVYWANSNTIIISDLPSEARLEPQYWGTLTLGE